MGRYTDAIERDRRRIGRPDMQTETAMGIPAYAPSPGDRQTVSLLAAAGVSRQEIAECVGKFGVDIETLELHFSRELRTAKNRITALAMHSISKAIQRAEPWACTLWMKSRGGWSDNPRYQVEIAAGRDRKASLEDIDAMISEADETERLNEIQSKPALTIDAIPQPSIEESKDK